MIKVKKLIMVLVAIALWSGLQLPAMSYNSNEAFAAPAAKTAVSTAKPQARKITGPELKAIRYGNGNSPSLVRIVMDLSQAMEYTAKTENDGKRLIVTVYGMDTLLKAAPDIDSHAINNVILAKYGTGKDSTVQLIVDMPLPLKTSVNAIKKPDRLVIDIVKKYENNAEAEPYPGMKYYNYVRLDDGGIFTAYVLDIDRSKFNVKQVLAGGNISSGRDTVSSIASDNGAVAAVNAGYFSNDGSLIGCNRIGGKTAGTVYYSRSSMGFAGDGSIKFGQIGYNGLITLGRKTLNAGGVNIQRGANTSIIYNSLYGSRTGTNQYGMEYTVRNNKVTAIQKGNSVIPEDGYVISVHGTAMTFFKGIKIGDKAVIYQDWGEEWALVPDIIGAGPRLLADGKVKVTSAEEEFPADVAVGQAPRTAMGVTAAGHILLAVIDGRQDSSMGATLPETARFLQRYGAVNAINLDGGGSSEMVLAGKVVNSPSDGYERPVGSAIVVLKK